MYHDLYEYLVLNRQLSMPGIGTFLLERKPAETDITHRQIKPAMYSISFDNSAVAAPSKRFFYWLSEKKGLQYHEAIVKFNGFTFDLKNQVLAGHKVIWEQVGTFSKGMKGDIRFESILKEQQYDPPVSAVKLIREKAEHNVRVGEDEKTSSQMVELLKKDEEKKSYWWVPALVVALLLLIIAGFYFSKHGWKTSSAANQEKVTPQKSPGTRKVQE
jgi:hypothetical protein